MWRAWLATNGGGRAPIAASRGRVAARAWTGALVFLLVASGATGGTIRVPSEAATIQAGIDAASPGDTVLVAPGHYEGDGNEMLSIAKDLVLRSEAGARETIIEPGISSFGMRIGWYGVSVNTVIEGFSVVNAECCAPGTQAPGGGAWCQESTVLFQGCEFINCRAVGGGGVACRDSSIRFEDCLFWKNGWGSSGGALSVEGSDVEIVDCAFVENVADSQGAIVVYSGGSLRIDRSTFLANECIAYGSGVIGFASPAPTVTIENTVIAFSVYAKPLVGQTQKVVLRCSNLYGNEHGEWEGEEYAGQLDQNGNISADPLFCDPSSETVTIDASSPCAPAHSGGCGLIGAGPVACVDGSPVSPTTWGAIKKHFLR